jgi:hypothetical protein
MRDDLDRPLVINPLVVVQRMPKGAVLMDTASGQCFELNGMGLEVWSELERGVSPSQIIRTLAARYRVPEGQVAADIGKLVNQLLGQGIVRSSVP